MNKIFDLQERTAKFGEAIIDFVKKLPKSVITIPLIKQLVRSGTSVGANYCEADCAESRKDFEHKLGICKKEVNETQYWFRIIQKAVPDYKEDCELLSNEAQELKHIFISIIKKSRNSS